MTTPHIAPRMTALSVVSAYYEAFNRDDTDAMEALLTEDFEHHVNEGQIRRGVAAFTSSTPI